MLYPFSRSGEPLGEICTSAKNRTGVGYQIMAAETAQAAKAGDLYSAVSALASSKRSFSLLY